MENHKTLNEPIAGGAAMCVGENNPERGHHELSERSSTGEAELNQASNAVPDCDGAKDDNGGTVRSDPLRFLVMLSFSFLSITNAMQWIAFSSIVDEVRSYFHMSAAEVNILPTIYVIAYISIVFLSCKLYEIAGIKVTLVIAALSNATGAWLKIIALYVWPSPVLLYASQAVNSMTEVLTIATPPLIANRWFPKRERAVANTIMSTALSVGCGVGVLVPTFFVGPGRAGKANFAQFFWLNAWICTATLAMVIFLIPRRPRYSASFAAQILQRKEDARMRWRRPGEAREGPAREKGEAREGNPPSASSDPEPSLDGTAEVDPVNVFSVLMDCFRMCRQSRSLVLLILMSAAELGLVWAMATVLPQAFKPYNISEAMTGWISFTNLVLGTLLCPFLMPLVERFNGRYKLILSATALVLLLDLIAMTLLIEFKPRQAGGSYYTWVIFCCWGVIAGLCQNFTMPLMFEYLVELTFPMPESTSAPMLMWSACATNIALTLIFGAVLTENPDKGKSLIIFISSIGITFIGAVAIILTKPQHKRQNYEMRRFLEQDQLLNSAENEKACE